jgi:chromosome segregation ATPase
LDNLHTRLGTRTCKIAMSELEAKEDELEETKRELETKEDELDEAIEQGVKAFRDKMHREMASLQYEYTLEKSRVKGLRQSSAKKDLALDGLRREVVELKAALAAAKQAQTQICKLLLPSS